MGFGANTPWLTYRDLEALMRDLRCLGAGNAAQGRPRGLTGKGRPTEGQERYERHRRNGVLPATYEVVFGHAWAPLRTTRPQDGSTVAMFPLVRVPRPAVADPRSADGPGTPAVE